MRGPQGDYPARPLPRVFIVQMPQHQPPQAVGDQMNDGCIQGLDIGIEIHGIFQGGGTHAAIGIAPAGKTGMLQTPAQQRHVQAVHPETMNQHDRFFSHKTFLITSERVFTCDWSLVTYDCC